MQIDQARWTLELFLNYPRTNFLEPHRPSQFIQIMAIWNGKLFRMLIQNGTMVQKEHCYKTRLIWSNFPFGLTILNFPVISSASPVWRFWSMITWSAWCAKILTRNSPNFLPPGLLKFTKNGKFQSRKWSHGFKGCYSHRNNLILIYLQCIRIWSKKSDYDKNRNCPKECFSL